MDGRRSVRNVPTRMGSTSQLGPGRAVIGWPDGSRCALAISWDVDFDSDLHLLDPAHGFEQYGAMTNFRFDEVGLVRVVKALRELGLRQTFFVCGWCLEQYPSIAKTLLDDGHEIAHHGYMHEKPNGQTKEGELRWLRQGIVCIEAAGGQRPRGWRAPSQGFSQYSASFLIGEGFLYDSSLSDDDTPYEIATPAGTLIELPMDVSTSDWPHYSHVPELDYLMSPKAPSDAMRYFREEFEATYRDRGFMTTVWHPHVSGRRSRVDAWRTFLEELVDRGDVWLATLEEVALHCRQVADSGAWVPRRRNLPYYTHTPYAVSEVRASARHDG
jgi:peptidoglycan/xylan/chitin deacetylase (PgdA/CDA1 family)